MKKNLILIVLLILCLKFSLILAACNNSNETNQPITDEDLNFDNNDNEDLIPSNGNILVAYFSWSASSNTERMATYIAEQTNAILYEIEPLVPYPTEYTPTTEVAAQEKEENARPKIKNPIDISNFDYIFVGFPIWWHTAPMIIGTFLESYNLDSKDIYPFFQGASNNNSSYYMETMAFINKCAPSANVHDGLYAAATDTAKTDEYLDAIDFHSKQI